MICPKCSEPMVNQHGRIFICHGCGHMAKGNPNTDRCLVCGGDLDDLGNGFTCPTCNSISTRKRYPIRVYERKSISISTFSMILIFTLLFSIISTAYIAKASTEEFFEVELRPDPSFSNINVVNNLGEDTIDDIVSTIDQWRVDLGNDAPNGTYYGTLLRGSAFDHDRYRPYWLPKDDYAATGRFSYVMLSAHFNFSSQVLISGCSEWWMKVPVLATSIEWSEGLKLAIWRDATDLELAGFDTRLYYSNYIHVRPSYNGYVPDDILVWVPPNYQNHYGDPLAEGNGDLHVVNNSVYVKCHAVLRPERDYIFSFYFRLPSAGTLKTLWTTAESPAGRSTRLAFADYKISSNWGANHTYLHNMTDQEIVDIGMDLDWSFIFTQGIGQGGMFGLSVEIENNTRINTYPFFNTTVSDSLDGTIHMSFMMPWISTDTFNMTFRVSNMWDEGVSGGYDYPHWEFEPDPPDPLAQTFEWSSDQQWDYRDFALFSTNWTLDFDGIDYPFTENDRYNVGVTWVFHNAGNLTLLCYDVERQDVNWNQVTPFPNNTTTWPFARNSIYNGNDYSSYYLEYGIYVSSRGTHGEWAIRTQTTSGKMIYTHCFPSRIHLSKSEYHIRAGGKSVDLSPTEQAWQDAKDLWADGHKLRAIVSAIRATVLSVWEGYDTVKGWISDGLSSVWGAMKELGEWIYTNLVSFFEKIVNFVDDVFDLLLEIWGTVKYIVAPVMLMAIYGGSMKVVRNWAIKEERIA